MDDRAWARHANPWSGYTRAVGSIGVFFTAWSLYWIGWWGFVPLTIAVLWTWLNPRLFPPPNNTESWMTKGALGERVFLNRRLVSIPAGYLSATIIINGFSFAFLLICAYGFLTQNFWAAFAGWHAAVMAKIWWVDRMVRLWELMRDKDDLYRRWNNAEWT